jgi:hypothetical protein
VVIPYAGWSERVILGMFGLLFLIGLGNGFHAIRARQIQQHREWMIRAFAVGLAIATTRLIQIPAIIVLVMHNGGAPTEEQLGPLVIISFTLAFSMHAVLAEVWIRRSRGKPGSAAGPRPTITPGQADVVG